MSRSEQNGNDRNSLREHGFTSHTDVYYYVPTNEGGAPLTDGEHYQRQCRITQTVTTPLGTVQLTAEHRQPADHMWKFDGGIRGEGNANTAVRVLLAITDGQLFGYVQEIHPQEGILSDTGAIRLIPGR